MNNNVIIIKKSTFTPSLHFICLWLLLSWESRKADQTSILALYFFVCLFHTEASYRVIQH